MQHQEMINPTHLSLITRISLTSLAFLFIGLSFM